jgi:hypothetical protein
LLDVEELFLSASFGFVARDCRGYFEAYGVFVGCS